MKTLTFDRFYPGFQQNDEYTDNIAKETDNISKEIADVICNSDLIDRIAETRIRKVAKTVEAVAFTETHEDGGLSLIVEISFGASPFDEITSSHKASLFEVIEGWLGEEDEWEDWTVVRDAMAVSLAQVDERIQQLRTGRLSK